MKFSRMSVRLGVNIDHVATLRQQRAGLVNYPDIVQAARLTKEGGADLLTIHVRGDRRHIQESDLGALSLSQILPLNLEMAANLEMRQMAVKYKPFIVCLVPEKREELTTEGGLDVIKSAREILETVHEMKSHGIMTSLFIEPNSEQIKKSKELGADAVEFHTGVYAIAKGHEKAERLKELKNAFEMAHELGLLVHAGHGLDYENLEPLLALPHLREVNIGHSIVCRAVLIGLKEAVTEMKALINKTS